MVLGDNLVSCQNQLYQHDTDKSDDSDSDSEQPFKNSLTIPNEKDLPSFGNIVVSDSKDVHFGNKTYYQGPVTIKQFLYANGQNNDEPGEDKTKVAQLSHNNETPICDAVVFVPSENGLLNPNFINSQILGESTIKSDKNKELSADFNNKKGGFCFSTFLNRKVWILLSFSTVLLVSLVVTAVVLVWKESPVESGKPVEDNDEQAIGTPIDYPFDPQANLTVTTKLKIISRVEWLAQPPSHELDKLELPVPNVIIHHTATENCTSMAQCIFHVRIIQSFHIESRNWDDIGYNFLVGGTGFVYEGRGWKTQGAHLYGYNSRSIGIAFIGTFTNYKPPERQIRACKLLIEQGQKLGYLTDDYRIVTARQLQTTESPGLALHNEVKTWPHWSPVPGR